MTYMTRVARQVPHRGVGDLWDDIDTLMSGGAVTADQANPTDQVNQTASGTSTSTADFTSVNGVCTPKNFPALAAARGMQGQLNRVAQVKGYSKIAADGAIGPATLALFRLVQIAAGAGAIGGDASACINIAADCDVLGPQIQAFADTIGAPAVVSPALSLSVPSITTNSGQKVVASDAGLLGQLATLSSMERLALGGLAVGIGYLLMKGKKKKARR